jgi:perosamine synthetase
LLALRVKKGDEIIIPSYTCTAVLNAVNYVNAKPVLVDIDPATFNITPALIKKKLSRRTKAIILTHAFGYPADINGIMKLGVSVIEDCAQGIGAKYKGRPVGSRGIISIFSLYATKMITSAEGGMLCTDNKRLADLARDLNNPDLRDSYKVRYNYKMSDLAAGLGLSQLRKLDYFLKRRYAIAASYKEAFSHLPLELQRAIPNTKPSYYRFVLCTPGADKLIALAKRRGVVFDRPVYKPLHRYLKLKGGFSNTDYVWQRAVSIPIYPALARDEISKIIDIVQTGIRQ